MPTTLEAAIASKNEVKERGEDTTEEFNTSNSISSLRQYLAALKRPADRKCIRSLGPDGVIRILHYLPTPDDEESQIEVYDALPLSPAQIKIYLDRKPWSQATEDRYRGVDGTTVQKDQWMNPPEGVLPRMGTRNERLAEIRRIKEQLDREYKEIEARGEQIPSCGMIMSDYDLSPR
jgi:hypothetical protein